MSDLVASIRRAAPVLAPAAEPSGLLQRRCACGNHVIAGGQCDECRARRGGPPELASTGGGAQGFARDLSLVRAEDGLPAGVRAKLVVGRVDDPYEREADHVAEAVVRLSEGVGVTVRAGADASPVQRDCGDCSASNESGEEELRRKPETGGEREALRAPGESAAIPAVDHGVESELDRARGGGRPLPASLREFFEPRFGHDLGAVRLHTDARAAAVARRLGAEAFTRGDEVFFGAGRFRPDTTEGRRLLAHELTHTVQQRASARSLGIQRQPIAAASAALCTTLHPEDCILFESWLGTFAALPDFGGRFLVNGVDRDPQRVLGSRAPASVPSPAPAPLRGNTRGIERPWAGWLRANLPPSLVETAYELPTDCADLVLILRHVWLAAHGRTERVGPWTLGRGVSRAQVRQAILNTGTRGLHTTIAFYRDANGDVLRSLGALLPLLHAGDVLVWEHRDARGRRTGGHSETIEAISFNPTVISTLQGNQPLTGSLGGLPGWRIERGGLDRGDLRDLGGVWTWADGTTVLIGAGPWGGTQQSRTRPPAPARGAARRVLRDWSLSLATATLADLPGVLEGALAEVRAALEGQRAIPPAEARAVGEQIGRRLWEQARRARDLGMASHFEPLQRLLRTIDAWRRATRPTGSSTQSVIDAAYAELRAALELAARGASSLRFPRGGLRRTRDVNLLVTGFDPFTGSATPPSPESWNTSGAAALALDGEPIHAGGGIVAHVESVVLPVDFTAFSTGMVESIARPLLPDLDGIVTVSMDSSLADRAALERYAVNFHDVPASMGGPGARTGPIPLPPVVGGPQPTPGPAVSRAWSSIDALARPVSPNAVGTFVRSAVTLRFATAAKARAAIADLGLQPAQWMLSGNDLEILDPAPIDRILAGAGTPSGQPANHLRWSAFRGGGTTFEAAVVAGPGGSFLSNEVSYRMLRLLGQQRSGAASFHVHTPGAPAVPVAERNDPRSRARRAAAKVRSSVIGGLRRVLAALARRLRP